MSKFIHPTAIIYPGAQIDDDCNIGPYCVIGSEVHIRSNTKLHNNVTVMGRTQIGQRCEIYPFAVIGGDPQDLKHDRDTQSPNKFDLVIYGDNTIREFVTIHGGTNGGVTEIGSYNLLMVGCHVAHDCDIGGSCVFSNGVQLAGHVRVGNRVTIGGMTGVHQFVTIHDHAFIAGMSSVTRDVLPYMMYDGRKDGKDTSRAINKVGLRRSGFSEQEISYIQRTFELIRDWCLRPISDMGTPTDMDDEEQSTFNEVMQYNSCQSLFNLNSVISRSSKGRVRENAARLKPMCC